MGSAVTGYLGGALASPAEDARSSELSAPFWLGAHAATHSWCLAAVLPVALAGARYGRRGTGPSATFTIHSYVHVTFAGFVSAHLCF